MKVAIRYYSKTGNTKKLADAISTAVGVPAHTLATPISESTDILFLGSSVYAAGVDKDVKDFIGALDPTKVKKVVNFSTAAILSSTYSQITKLLADKGIEMDKREFHCRGKFKVMHSGRPNQKDLQEVKEFARRIM